MSTNGTDRIALDAATVVQSLSREAAAMQARAVAQRALVAAATRKQLGLIAADAAVLASVYEEAAQALYDQINAIVSRPRGGVAAGPPAAQQPQAPQPQPANASPEAPGSVKKGPSASAATAGSLAALVALACDNKAAATKRWAALAQLAATGGDAVDAATKLRLRTAYVDVAAALPSLRDCIASLAGVGGVTAGGVIGTLQQAAATRADEHGCVADAVATAYRRHIDDAVLTLSSGVYAAPEQPQVEEVLRQLRRLRDDVDVAKWVAG